MHRILSVSLTVNHDRMKVVIAGATGLTGGLCLQELLSHQLVSEVISVGRRSTGITHPKLKEILYTDTTGMESLAADAFICCLGTTMKKAGSKSAFRFADLELPLQIAEILKANGCRIAAVISSMGASSKSRIFYSRTKGQMEEGFRALHFDSLSILRPSIISGQRKEKRTGERIGLAVMKGIDRLLPRSMRHYKYIEAQTIAQALVTAVLQRNAGTAVYLSDDVKKLATEM